jgi:hypothetical protein
LQACSSRIQKYLIDLLPILALIGFIGLFSYFQIVHGSFRVFVLALKYPLLSLSSCSRSQNLVSKENKISKFIFELSLLGSFCFASDFCKDLAKLMALWRKFKMQSTPAMTLWCFRWRRMQKLSKQPDGISQMPNTESLVMHVHFMFSIFNFCKVPNGRLQSIMKSLEWLLEFFRNNRIQRFVKFDVQKKRKPKLVVLWL